MKAKLVTFLALTTPNGRELKAGLVHQGAGVLDTISELCLPHSIFSKIV